MILSLHFLPKGKFVKKIILIKKKTHLIVDFIPGTTIQEDVDKCEIIKFDCATTKIGL